MQLFLPFSTYKVRHNDRVTKQKVTNLYEVWSRSGDIFINQKQYLYYLIKAIAGINSLQKPLSWIPKLWVILTCINSILSVLETRGKTTSNNFPAQFILLLYYCKTIMDLYLFSGRKSLNIYKSFKWCINQYAAITH